MRISMETAGELQQYCCKKNSFHLAKTKNKNTVSTWLLELYNLPSAELCATKSLDFVVTGGVFEIGRHSMRMQQIFKTLNVPLMCVCMCATLSADQSCSQPSRKYFSVQLQCRFCYCVANPLILLRAAAAFDKATSQPVSRMSLLLTAKPSLNWYFKNIFISVSLLLHWSIHLITLMANASVCFPFPFLEQNRPFFLKVILSQLHWKSLKCHAVNWSNSFYFFSSSCCSITDRVADSISSNTDSPLSNPICVYDVTRAVMFHQSL